MNKSNRNLHSELVSFESGINFNATLPRRQIHRPFSHPTGINPLIFLVFHQARYAGLSRKKSTVKGSLQVHQVLSIAEQTHRYQTTDNKNVSAGTEKALEREKKERL